MRRVLIFVVAFTVLAPSLASAAWYRCLIDGQVRTSCCCEKPRSEANAQHRSPAESAVRARCCEVTRTEAVAPPRAEVVAAWVALDRPAVIAAPALALSVPVTRVTVHDHPRWFPGPPDPLFARHCALLL